MHQQIREALRRPLALALAAGAVGALTLSACGGGSSGNASTGTGTNAAATSATAGSGDTGKPAGKSGGGTTAPSEHPRSGSGATGGAGARGRFGAVRACLQRNGVKLPTRPGGGLFLGGASLPKGASRAQLQAAMRTCLGGRGFFAGGGPGAFRRRTASPRFRQALSAFAACLRQNGIAVPAPNTSGGGPVFSTKGLDTSSPKFRAATAKCRSTLIGAFGLHRSGPGGAGAQPAQPGTQPTG
jgi:hypothetical protein